MCQREREWSGTVARIVVLLVLLAPAAAWAASEGGHEGGLISLDKSLIVQGVNFLILLFILQRLLYKPFLAKMEERTQAIQKSLDEAQAARAAAAPRLAANVTQGRAKNARSSGCRVNCSAKASSSRAMTSTWLRSRASSKSAFAYERPTPGEAFT